ncbi:MAG: glycine--tRNA ligase [Candidatus Moranbacteria bacterium]|nr:glycine--tRNA ligase [Candidatus Moranbacteria bacterium]
MAKKEENLMEKIVNLCKRRGFIIPSSEIYGGFSATYDFGPIGAILKNNLKEAWWNLMVRDQADVVGLDGAIICHPRTWEASGHVESFSDPLVEDKKTHERLRADHIIEDYCEENKIDQKELSKKILGEYKDVCELTIEEMGRILSEEKIKSPKGNELTLPKVFNLLVEARLGATEQTKQSVYLRGETCQVIFLQYKNIMETMRMKLPFGVAQMGKVFRNEITTKQFVLRMREFEQMEFEYFVSPKDSFEAYEKWEKFFVEKFLVEILNISKKDIRLREIPEAEMSHYCKKQKDFEIKMANGRWLECSPMNHRGDWDLSRHGKYSKKDFTYKDEKTGTSFVPNVIETSFGVERLIYIMFEKFYKEEKLKNKEIRTVLCLPKRLAPIKIAIMPLFKKKELLKLSNKIWDNLRTKYMTEHDITQSIGKRYRRQDEIGTPYCVTIDFESLEDGKVTVRDRDTMEQKRVEIEKLEEYFNGKFN